jgi:hypothetical protein
MPDKRTITRSALAAALASGLTTAVVSALDRYVWIVAPFVALMFGLVVVYLANLMLLDLRKRWRTDDRETCEHLFAHDQPRLSIWSLSQSPREPEPDGGDRVGRRPAMTAPRDGSRD